MKSFWKSITTYFLVIFFCLVPKPDLLASVISALRKNDFDNNILVLSQHNNVEFINQPKHESHSSHASHSSHSSHSSHTSGSSENSESVNIADDAEIVIPILLGTGFAVGLTYLIYWIIQSRSNRPVKNNYNDISMQLDKKQSKPSKSVLRASSSTSFFEGSQLTTDDDSYFISVIIENPVNVELQDIRVKATPIDNSFIEITPSIVILTTIAAYESKKLFFRVKSSSRSRIGNAIVIISFENNADVKADELYIEIPAFGKQ